MVLVGRAQAVDFEKNDVQGKWAVCFDDLETTPEERRALAKRAGAKGLIILPNPRKNNPEQNYRLHKLVEMAKAGSLRYPIDCDFDELMFTRKGAKRLLALMRRGGVVQKARGLTDSPFPLAGKPALTLTDTRVVSEPFAAVNATNVVAFWKGSDPELSKEAIIISAHYDHLGGQGGRIFNGADDNGSGTATLVALAEAIQKLNPKRSIILMWVSGEEKGLLGSAAFVENPYFPEGVKPIADLNMDMVGRNEDNKLYITPSKNHRYYNGLTKLYERFATLEGFTVLDSADNVWSRSDHAEFIKLIGPNGQRIKVAFTTTGMHPQYHKTTDDADLINYPKMARIVRLDLRVLEALQADKLDL
jgi:hypothetical protein